jgi:hypothetical protein
MACCVDFWGGGGGYRRFERITCLGLQDRSKLLYDPENGDNKFLLKVED